MPDFAVAFRIRDDERYARLKRVVDALVEAKRSGVFHDDVYWLSFFDEEARRHFWWPTEAELTDWLRRWQATPVEDR